jgi:cellulose synthase/poly-beta-1,6-N-acetylglucosamine synthase-like glycosyltransferase
VYAISLFYKKPVKRTYPYPTVSVLMSVYNEERNIEKKIQSLFELDYPEPRIEILIGSDGSTDGTDKKIEGVTVSAKSIRFFKHKQRMGKPSILNLLAKEAKGELLVFTDARQRLDKSSVDELVKNFADPKVGSVSAELHFEGNGTKTSDGMGLYWNYEKFIRKSESKIGSMCGATGALYCIRRELFTQLPEDLILDDVYLPMKIVENGYRAIFDKNAKIYDHYSEDAGEEFLRKSRTLAGNFQIFAYLSWLANPFKSMVSWQFISHKFLRLIAPYLLAAVFIVNFYLRNSGNLYQLTLFLQIAFYAFAFCGAFFKHKNRFFDAAYLFCVLNFAAVIGLYRFITKNQDVLWEKRQEKE